MSLILFSAFLCTKDDLKMITQSLRRPFSHRETGDRSGPWNMIQEATELNRGISSRRFSSGVCQRMRWEKKAVSGGLNDAELHKYNINHTSLLGIDGTWLSSRSIFPPLNHMFYWARFYLMLKRELKQLNNIRCHPCSFTGCGNNWVPGVIL